MTRPDKATNDSTVQPYLSRPNNEEMPGNTFDPHAPFLLFKMVKHEVKKKRASSSSQGSSNKKPK